MIRNIQETSKKHPRNIQEGIYELLKSNQLTKNELDKIARSQNVTAHNMKGIKIYGRKRNNNT